MKKITLILLLLVSKNVFSEWALIAGNTSTNNKSTYVDWQSIKKNGHKVKMWNMIDSTTVESIGSSKIKFLSEISHQEYDCVEETKKLLDVYFYAENNAAGGLVASQINIKMQPYSVIPGTDAGLLWSVACGYIHQTNKKTEKEITLEITLRFIDAYQKSGMSGVSTDIEKCYASAVSRKTRDMQVCIIYDTSATYLDRSFLMALGVKEMSTTPFLSQGAFDMRMDIYKETAFKDYMDNDAIRFIKEARDHIIKEFIKST
jgi:hypothetical protein